MFGILQSNFLGKFGFKANFYPALKETQRNFGTKFFGKRKKQLISELFWLCQKMNKNETFFSAELRTNGKRIGLKKIIITLPCKSKKNKKRVMFKILTKDF